MNKEQLMHALLIVQSAPNNFEKLAERDGNLYAVTPQVLVMGFATELYSDELLDYMNKNMRAMPIVDMLEGTFSFADFFESWDGAVQNLHVNPCVLVGRSYPKAARSAGDVTYESFVGTYIDDTGYVFNAEVRQYCFKNRGEFVNLVTRQPCNDGSLRLDCLEEFFPEEYAAFWS